LTPSSTLAGATTYTATVTGGAAGVKDTAGNALVSDRVWSFTTGLSAACPCTLWPNSTTPSNPSDTDTNPVNLGVKFTSDQSGFITGIRFYKGPSNTGIHVGTLWTSGGVQLATATFAAESASGWQQVNFASPVAIVANTVYVASYFAPNGGYAYNSAFFEAAGVINAPLRALQNGVSGGNGVYAYASTTTFPTSTYRSNNYWVDVVFTTVINP
jgi:hypothetical protein